MLRELNWRTMKASLAVYFAIGIAVVVLTPEGALDRLPGARALVDSFESFIPGIARLAHVSPFPDAMKLALVVLWTGLPIAALRIHRAWHHDTRIFMLKKSDLWFVVLSIWAIAALMILPLYFFFDVSRAHLLATGGRGGLLMRWLTQSRLSAGLLAPLWFCGAATCLGIATSMTARAIAVKRPAS